MLRLVRGSEAPFLAILFRRGLHERNISIFAVQIEKTIGAEDRSRTDARRFPAHFAGSELDGYKSVIRICPIQVIAGAP